MLQHHSNTGCGNIVLLLTSLIRLPAIASLCSWTNFDFWFWYFQIEWTNQRKNEREEGSVGRIFYRHATQRWVVANNRSDRCDNLVPVAATPQQKLDLDLQNPHYKYYASFNFNLLKVILPPRWCQNPSGKQALWRYPIWPLCCKKIGKVSKQQEAVFFHVYFPACLHGYPHEYLAHTSENTNQRINKK